MESKCVECAKSFTQDFYKGKTALRCRETGRVLMVYPAGHETVLENLTAPKWCKEVVV